MAARFDESKQAAVVALLQAGFRRSQAAARVGITSGTIRAAIRAGMGEHGEPLAGTFAEAVAEAEDTAAGEIERRLYEAAQLGEPWAVQLWLKAHLRDEYNDKAAAVQVNVQNNNLVVEGTAEDRRDSIAQLMRELDARRELSASGVVDAEVVED